MDKIQKLEEEIKILEKEKEKELLRIEVEKLKKTIIEETTIIKKQIIQHEPSYPQYPFGPSWNTRGIVNC